MHEAAKIKPVVIDESNVDLLTLAMAMELGYSGVAFKACKGWKDSLLSLTAASAAKLFLCVQDLTCPSLSFAHSCAQAARFKGVVAIEGNSEQYMPLANKWWKKRFSGLLYPPPGLRLNSMPQ